MIKRTRNNMLDFNTLQKVDSKKMFKVYDDWPKIAKESYFLDADTIEYQKCSHIVFAGMGGSGALGDIFAAILSKTDTHVTVVKGYHLPKTVTKNSVVVITSISGNTVETISMLENAIKLNAKIIAFSDGGKIQELCTKRNIPHRKITKYHSPRASFPSFLFSMLHVLKPILPINKNDVLESIEKLEEVAKKINSENISDNNPAIKIAKWMNGIPIIYYPWGLEPVAIRFKNSLQENSKIHAVTEDVIESCHNGIVAWDKTSMLKPILMQGDDDYIKTKERWNILKEFFDKKNIEYKEIFSVKGNILSKLISLIYFCDYVTIYRAVLNKTDPTPVDAIEYIKKRL